MEDFVAYVFVVRGRMVLGDIVGEFVLSPGDPIDEELTLFDPVLDPVETHVYCFGALVFYCTVREPDGGGVVDFHWGWALGVSKFFEGDADGACLSGVEEGGADLSFHGGAHDGVDDFREDVYWAVGRGWCGWDIGRGGWGVTEEEVSACAAFRVGGREVRCVAAGP